MIPGIGVLAQYVMPRRGMTSFAGFMASRRSGSLPTRLIRWFVGEYQVDMSEAVEPDITRYASFNDFFTRALRPGVRPIAGTEWVSPVDGALSQFGRIEHDQILQAKGHRYSTAALVGGDPSLASLFDNGHFATIYLSPRDYHRVHMPCDGRLLRMTHVPGDLFSVNPATALGVPGLFARNERVVCVFETARGPLVLALVGATIVGSVATVWHGVVNPPRGGPLRDWHYLADGSDGEISLKKGDEMGRFLLGSTVVMLFPQGPMQFSERWSPGRSVRLGEAMATAVV